MACEITLESYNGSPSLYANARKIVNAETKFTNIYTIGSGVSRPFDGVSNKLIISSGVWSDYIAMIPGDLLEITVTNPASGSNPTSFQMEVQYVSGNTVFFTNQLPAPYNSGQAFPTSSGNYGMLIRLNRAPDSVEFSFNLTINGTQSEDSLIDNEKNIFRADNIAAMTVGQSVSMVQQGNKSGGHIWDVSLKLDSVGGYLGITRQYSISYKFIQWGIIQDGYDEPVYYDNTGHLAPYIVARCYSQAGNPNAIQVGKSNNVQADTGGYDMNFNGGVNNYTHLSTSWVDFNGNSIDGLDYSNPSSFTARIHAPSQNGANSTFDISLVWRPQDASRYKNKSDSLGYNLRANIPSQTWTINQAVDNSVYQGFELNGSRFDLTEIDFTYDSVNSILTVKGKVIPIGFVPFFDNVPVGDKKITIDVGVSDYNLTGAASDLMHIKIYDEDAIDAPLIGVQYPYVLNQSLLDHGGYDVTSSVTPNTTTEDNILYKSEFLLDKNTQYDGVRARIFARNDITGDEFSIPGEEIFFDFSTQPYLSGVHNFNEEIARGLFLHNTSDRNHISLKRRSDLDTATQYGMEIQYGFISRYESWISNASVNDFFYDQNELNDGKNQNWQRFTNGDWQLYLAYYVRKNDVDDFQVLNIKTRPYDDDNSVNFAYEFTHSNGAITTDGFICIPSNPIVECKITITWNQNFSNEWFEVTMREKEGQRVGFASSVNDYDNNGINVLEPISGQTKLDVNITGITAIVKTLIDSSKININNVSLTCRVRSDDRKIPPKDVVLFENSDPVQHENEDYVLFE